MINRRKRNPVRRTTVLAVLLGLVLIVVLASFALTYRRWEGQAPQIAFDRDFKALGRAPSLILTVADPGTGLKHVAIRLKQKDQEVVLAEESLDGAEKSKTYDIGKLILDKYQEGPASISISASDHALRNFLRGNQT